MHAFLLTVYLGVKVVSNDMYFKNVDTCLYFAQRLNNQPQVPNKQRGDNQQKKTSYTAVCAPAKVDKTTKLYN
jgi:hypothetical protein|tara:strand:- start:503 stop:721 length:219 start_codon:yes stop_codon:yes gene_type:complete